MNVLFYTSCEVSPETGGTERITASISQGLSQQYGVKCYSLYRQPAKENCKLTNFAGKLCIPHIQYGGKRIRSFIKENAIDIIIIQGSFIDTKFIRQLIPLPTKVVFVHHFCPGSEEDHMQFNSLLRNIAHGKQVVKTMARMVLFPFMKFRYLKHLPKYYQDTYQYADKVVLLSMRFMDDFLRYGNIANNNPQKIAAIHNSLSFNDFFDMGHYSEKKKQVLIVSRLAESQKRISYALRIWKSIEQQTELKDWELVIVGHGPDESNYRRYVATHHLERVRFEGRQSPKCYYKEASIFMLTSSYEGWGLTLTEAQQFGCVPLAFYSYASLPDIITDKENGFMIDFPNLEGYKRCLVKLMKDDDLRRNMAEKAIESSHRFSSEKICAEWMNLFNNLQTENN